MEDFQPGLSFGLVNRAEISARTSYVLLRKQRFRLHEKNSARAEISAHYALSSRLRLPGMKFSSQLIGLKIAM